MCARTGCSWCAAEQDVSALEMAKSSSVILCHKLYVKDFYECCYDSILHIGERLYLGMVVMKGSPGSLKVMESTDWMMELRLCIGCRVVLNANISVPEEWTNGNIRTVTRLTSEFIEMEQDGDKCKANIFQVAFWIEDYTDNHGKVYALKILCAVSNMHRIHRHHTQESGTPITMEKFTH